MTTTGTSTALYDDTRNQIISIIQQPYFIIPFIFWFSCYVYCQTVAAIVMTKKNQSSSSCSSSSSSHSNPNQETMNDTTITTTTITPIPFHKWYTIHNIHNFGAILLGTISIVFAEPYPIIVTSSSSSSSSSISSSISVISSLFQQSNYNERIPILWSLSYFMIDIIDCCIRQDYIYTIHGICCLILGYMNYTIPVLQILKMNSKATYCELSNPFMHLAKRTRQPLHFILFAIVYTFCRIVWIPIMYYQLISYNNKNKNNNNNQHHHYMTDTDDTKLKIAWYHPISCILIAFYILNLYWYMKIINILVTGGNSSGGKTRHPDTKKSQ